MLAGPLKLVALLFAELTELPRKKIKVCLLSRLGVAIALTQVHFDLVSGSLKKSNLNIVSKSLFA